MAIQNFIPTVWSETLYKNLDKKYIAVANCNRDFEGDIKEKGSVVKICGVGDVFINDYTKNYDMDMPQDLSDTVAELAINQAKYFNFQIDDVDKAQCSHKLMDAAMKNAASGLADQAEKYVYSLYSKAGKTLDITDANETNIIDYIIKARTEMYKNNVENAEDIIIEVSPDVAELILKAKVSLSTDNSDTLENGCIGSIGGCKIFVSNNVVCEEDMEPNIFHDKCFVRTKRAIAFAEQLSEINAYRPEKRFADAVKGLYLFGAKVIYSNEFIVLDIKIDKNVTKAA